MADQSTKAFAAGASNVQVWGVQDAPTVYKSLLAEYGANDRIALVPAALAKVVRLAWADPGDTSVCHGVTARPLPDGAVLYHLVEQHAGMHSVPVTPETVDALLGRADRGLYRHLGRGH